MLQTIAKLTLLAALLLIAIGARAQTPPEAKAGTEALKLSTDLVVLDVHVLTQLTGHAVSGLKKEDFTLYEDGVKQEITHFSYDRLPLSVVLLIDVSASVLEFVERIQQSALQALQRLKPEDEVALLAFANDVWLVRDFTLDRQALVEELIAVRSGAFRGRAQKLGGGGGPTAIGEGLYYAATQLIQAAKPKSRRAILIVTDNIPNDTNPPHSRADVTAQLLESSAVLHGLIVDDASGKLAKAAKYQPLSVFTDKVIFKSAGNVNGYAEKTGGKVIGANKDDVGAKLAGLIEQLRRRYSLGYTPTNTKFDGAYRKLKLKLSPAAEEPYGSLVVKTKPGYFAKGR